MTDLPTPGCSEMMWKNKTLTKGEPFDHHWRHYSYMSKTEAAEFMQIKAHRSAFFDFKVKEKPSPLPQNATSAATSDKDPFSPSPPPHTTSSVPESGTS